MRYGSLFGFTSYLLFDAPADGGGGGDAAAAAAAAAAGGAPRVITISEEEFEQRIVGRIKKAEAQWKKDHPTSTLTVEERAKLEQYERERDEAKRKELESKGQYEAALKAQEESIRKPYEDEKKTLATKIEGVTGRLRQEIVTNKLLAAAAAGNAYNAAQVVKLTEHYVKLDDDFNPTVVGDDGQPRFVAGKPMTPEQLVAEFLTANPNHVKAVGGEGGGASGGQSRTGSDASEFADLEKAVADAEKEYRLTRSTLALTAHRKAVEALNAAKRKKAA